MRLEDLPGYPLVDPDTVNPMENARARFSVHKGDPSSKFFVKDPIMTHYLGVMGELATAKAFDLKFDASTYKSSDERIDFYLLTSLWPNGVKLDAKTRTTPKDFMVPEANIRCCSDVIILCHYIHDRDVRLLRWVTKEVMQKQPKGQFGKWEDGICYYYPSKGKLARPMNELEDYLGPRCSWVQELPPNHIYRLRQRAK